MRLSLGAMAQLVLSVTIAVLAGCISPKDPYGGEPLPAPPASIAERAERQAPANKIDTNELKSAGNRSAVAAGSGAKAEILQAKAVASAVPPVVTPEEAIRFALQNNPTLQFAREQLGFAQGGVVIAKTYPYNPVASLRTSGVSGPDVSNWVAQSHSITMAVELRGQRFFRQEAAYAALTRTEWEIATQEVAVAISTVRAFNTVLYRQRKLEVLEDTIKLSQGVTDLVQKLVNLNRLRPADLIVIRTELDADRALLGQGQAALAVARADLRRQLGTFDDSFAVRGELDLPLPTTDTELFVEAAREKRPDVQSRKFAVTEAQARLRLQEADRYGNPTLGPAYEYNETRSNFIGVQLSGAIPVFNRRTGEILQAQATYARALADVHQYEFQAEQDVQAALARLTAARSWVESYTGEVLPHLQQAVKDMNKLFEQNDPGVDVIKVLGVQRNYLRAFDNYLNALYELSQARADLAAAIADPALAVGLYAPSTQPPLQPPGQLPPPKPLTAPVPK
jgi:cobalt-zinc-cadmium efflux system outer membrane protein